MRTIVPEKLAAADEAAEHTQRAWVVAFFALLFLADWYLYFWNMGHFFQGDTVFLLHHRPTSIREHLREFISLHLSGFYRPLANDILESVLYPVLGLNPVGYRIPVYALFMAISVAVYMLAFTITRRRIAAAIATFYFNIHTTNAYTTYDIGFMPELLYTFFYILSVLAYLRYIDRDTKSALRISLACFAASMLSKEAAVTLPLTLVALHMFIGFKTGEHVDLWRRIVRPFRATLGHFLVLIVYLLFVVGYLHVQSVRIEKLFNRPAQMETAIYDFVVDQRILVNADYAMTWAFNIPRGSNTRFRNLKESEVTFLKIFRMFIAAVLVLLLFQRERRILLVGVVWFFVTLLPALPLVNHFLPYYLFLSVVGFSLLVGSAFTWVCDTLRRAPYLAWPLVAGVLAGVLYVCSVSIHANIRSNQLLGESADRASSSLNGLKQMYPVLPPSPVIYIDDETEPVWWHHNRDALIQMAYNRSDVRVLYSSLGQSIPPEVAVENTILVRFENSHLTDYTAEFRDNPRRFTSYTDPGGHKLQLSANDVSVGDSYSLGISGLQDVVVNITYTVNDGRVEVFTTELDREGRARFVVSKDTGKGFYRFLGFNVEGQRDWFRAAATITAH